MTSASMNSMLPRDRNAVVSVLDEVNVTNLVKLDRWQADVLVVGPVHVLPAARRVGKSGKKGAVEVAEAVETADYLADRHLLHAPVTLSLRGVALANLVI
jgi:hypothetical protein